MNSGLDHLQGDSLDDSTIQAGSALGRQTADRHAQGSAVPALTILFHPDLGRIGDRALLPELQRGRPVALSRREPIFASTSRSRDFALRDRHLSRNPWHLRPADTDGGLILDPGSSSSTLRIDGKAVTAPRTFTSTELDDGVALELAGRMVLWLHLHRLAMSADPPDYGLVGQSHLLVRTRADIERVADLDVSVLIRGETGTGKELVAQAVHRASHRSGPFLAVNLAAIPESLAVAELFGARKGAFTGSNQDQPGYFARAHGGTLFLDEIGESSPELQAQLLRVLENGEIQPLGDPRPRRVDVRVVAATDADLEAKIASGSFRSPLLHRLAGFEIRLPALRDRRDDFGRLFKHFLEAELENVGESHRLRADDATTWLDPSIFTRLVTLPWPGNVRQLKNVVRQMVIGSRKAPQIQLGPSVERLLEDNAEPASNSARSKEAPKTTRRKPSTVTEDELRETLKARRWDLKTTAETLCISRTSLYALIEKFPSLRSPSEVANDEIRQAFEACEGDHEAMVERLEISIRTLRRRLRELGLT